MLTGMPGRVLQHFMQRFIAEIGVHECFPILMRVSFPLGIEPTANVFAETCDLLDCLHVGWRIIVIIAHGQFTTVRRIHQRFRDPKDVIGQFPISPVPIENLPAKLIIENLAYMPNRRFHNHVVFCDQLRRRQHRSGINVQAEELGHIANRLSENKLITF